MQEKKIPDFSYRIYKIRKTSFTHSIILPLQFLNWKFAVLKICFNNYSFCQKFPNKIIISENVSRASSIDFFPTFLKVLQWHNRFNPANIYCICSSQGHIVFLLSFSVLILTKSAFHAF